MESIILCVLVSFGIYLIRLGWKHLKYWLLDPPHKKEAVEDARIMMEKLRKKGFGNYLLRDYVFQTRITDQDMAQLSSIETKLNGVLQEILRYLKLPPYIPLHLVPENERPASKDDRGGEYDSGKKEISLFYRKHYSGDQMIGILCHECAHCFMYYNGLDYSDPAQNERFTDITACLLGFTAYSAAHRHTLGDTRTGTKNGYLKSAEMRAIHQELVRCRQQQGTSQNQQPNPRRQPTDSAKTLLRSHINSARVMLDQAKSVMAVKKIPTVTDLTQEAYAKLYQISQTIESGQTANILQRCEEALNKDAPAVRTADENVMKLNQELSFFLHAFR